MPSEGRRRAVKYEATYGGFDCLGYAVLIADRSAGIEYANSAARRFFGNTASTGAPTPAQKSRDSARDDIKLPGTVSSALARALAGEHILDEEVCLRSNSRPQGVWLSVRASPRLQAKGEIVGVIALFKDVTRERRQREEQGELLEAMQARTRRLEALFEHALDAVLLADDAMRLVEVNPSACRLLGYDRGGLLTLTVPEITAPEHRDGIREQWAQFLQAGSAEGELILAARSGNRVYAEFRAVANILPSLHLSIIRDISGRKLAEAGLRETQRTDSLGVMAGSAAHDFNNLLVGIIGNSSLALERISHEHEITPLLRDVLAAGERAAQLSRQMLTYAAKAAPSRESIDVGRTVRQIGALITSSLPNKWN